jgi:dipeptide/tripeptide permease
MVSFSLFISYHCFVFTGSIIIYYKIIPVKYASLMMGVYFAATGLGNKVAGIIGESASDLGEYSVFLGF